MKQIFIYIFVLITTNSILAQKLPDLELQKLYAKDSIPTTLIINLSEIQEYTKCDTGTLHLTLDDYPIGNTNIKLDIIQTKPQKKYQSTLSNYSQEITSNLDTLNYENFKIVCKNCITDSTVSPKYNFYLQKDTLLLSISPIIVKNDDLLFLGFINDGKERFQIIGEKFSPRREIFAKQNIFPPPTTWDKIKEAIFSNEGFLIGFILFLVTTLWKSITKKITFGIENFFDFLGKRSKGYFARRRFHKRYIDHILFQHKYLNLVGFNTAGISKPLLEDVFISLRVSNYDGNTRLDDFDKDGSKLIPFKTTMKRFPKLVILGMPGAGKTTTLSYALLQFAKNRGELEFEVKKELLPIFIPLRQLSKDDKTIVEDITNPKTPILPRSIKEECPQDYFKNHLKSGNCLVLLDGLDEVTDQKQHKEIARKIDEMVQTFPDNYYIVTCRIAGWQNLLNSDFTVLETQHFNYEEVQYFIRGWHKAIVTKTEKDKLKLEIPDEDEDKFNERWEAHQRDYVEPAIQKLSKELLTAIDSSNRIEALATNPMLLSLISLVHYNRATLPKGRTKLYKQCLDLLIDAWDKTRDILSSTKVTADEKEIILREIAFEFQLNGKGEETRENLVKIIHNLNKQLPVTPEKLIEDIERRSGILVERQIDVLGFSHLTLQEYLVAHHIHLYNDKYYPILKENFDHADWREVILLYTGLIGNATQLIKEIILKDATQGLSKNNLISNKRLLLGAFCVGDAQECDDKLVAFIIQELEKRLDNTNDKAELEQIEDAIAAIAKDFENYAYNIRQKLSAKLIKDIDNG